MKQHPDALMRCYLWPDGDVVDIFEKHLPAEGAGRTELLTFYSWSIDDATRAQNEWQRPECEPKAQGPFSRWFKAMMLLRLAMEYEKSGDEKIILRAVNTCVMGDFALPWWCAVAFRGGYLKITQRRAKSWDDAFGRPLPKGARLDVLREQPRKEWEVWIRIKEIRSEHPGTPLDRNGIFKIVGEELGLSSSLAEKYYYNVENSPHKPPLPLEIAFNLKQQDKNT